MIYKKIKNYIIPPSEIYNNYVSQKRNGRIIVFYKKLLKENSLIINNREHGMLYRRIESKFIKISECNQYWDLDLYKKQETKVFNRTNLCNDKFCANCRKVKQSLRFEKFKPLLMEHSENLYHLVLTVPNCYGDNLKLTIKKMFNSFMYLTRYLKGSKKIKGLDFESLGYKGALRSLEVTTNNNMYHPHLHIGIVLEGEFNLEKTNINKFSFSNKNNKVTKFSDFEIIIQKIWYLLNTNKRVTLNNINSLAYDDIYSCKLDKFEEDDYSELFKYIMKDQDLDKNLLTYENFKVYYYELTSVRQIQGYGCFYGLKDNDEDIFNIAEEEFERIVNELRNNECPIGIHEKPLWTLKSNTFVVSKKIVRKYLLKELEKEE